MRIYIFMAAAALYALAPLASAQNFERRLTKSSDRSTNELSVGGAVAAPSPAGFFGENPNGLIYTDRPRIAGFLTTHKDHPELLSNGLSFAAGNGEAAAT